MSVKPAVLREEDIAVKGSHGHLSHGIERVLQEKMWRTLPKGIGSGVAS